MNVLWFLPILSIMMFVHELGHFVTARFFGIKKRMTAKSRDA